MCGQRGSFGGEEGEKVLELIGAPCGIRTHGPRIRNPVLYPSELRGRAPARAKS